MSAHLPARFAGWFQGRGWTPHPHQLQVMDALSRGRSALLTAPTGGGKTLAGFLPTLAELADKPQAGLHTLYISPLKALAVDVQRNLMTPIAELDLPVTVETRTGDTSAARRQRQRHKPPNILLTTPESLALLLSHENAAKMFGSLRSVIVDEVHALAGSKRGDLLALGLVRLAKLAPEARRLGLSATVAWPKELAQWLQSGSKAEIIHIAGEGGASPDVSILPAAQQPPWSGHLALYAMDEVYSAIADHGTTLVFVNTRAQAEIVFRELWRRNEAKLPIGIHHGSLDVARRRRIEAALGAGKLRAVVATASLDLGVDWGAVDLVIQIGAPKGVSRLTQRIGRANHRLDAPSRGLLVPANRFEVLECRAAIEAIKAGELDGEKLRPGGLDVLAQHLLGMACAAPYTAEEIFEEITRAAPYAELARKDFAETLRFVENGGYALRSYDQWRKLFRDSLGRYHIVSPAIARRYRMNIGTIIEAPMLRVKLKTGRKLGEIEEHFIQGLTPGDTFIFAGEVLRFEGLRNLEVTASRTRSTEPPKIPSYDGGKLPLTTHLAERVRRILASPQQWRRLPGPTRHWLALQNHRSSVPQQDGLLVETFPRSGRHYLVAYPFEGRAAHQTLGMLLTRRMERAGLKPLGFVATDYLLAIWSLKPAIDIDDLFAQDMLREDLTEWLAESSLLKRSFRSVATIAGLIERNHPGHEKSRKQVTFSSDLIYDVLRRYEPNHVLLRATYADAAHGLTDTDRLAEMLARVKGKIIHRALERVSPLAVPAMLELGRTTVYGEGAAEALAQSAAALLQETELA